MKFKPPSTRKRTRAGNQKRWNPLTFSSLSVLALSAVIPLAKPVWSPWLSPLLNSSEANSTGALIQGADFNAASADAPVLAANRQSANAVLQSSAALAQDAIKRTELLDAQPWDVAKSTDQWRRIEATWETSAGELAQSISDYADSAQVEVGLLEQLRSQYHDHVNRADLTSAMHAHQESVFLAEQPAEGSSAQCDVEATFADSPEQWAQIVALRQYSVQRLNAVAEGVSFYGAQVAPLKEHYHKNLTWAGWMHQRSPWYYAIQKAVCATALGEQADDPSDWIQVAMLWQESIRLLEAAPNRIPVNIPNEYRDSYQAAKNNLALWKSNLKDAEARASAQR